MSDTVSRRRFLVSGLVLLGGIARDARADDADDADAQLTAWVELLETRLGPGPATAAVGRAYLALRPAEQDGRALLELVGVGPEWPALQQAIRADYAAGRTVDLAGWILSATEARLCALRWLQVRPVR